MTTRILTLRRDDECAQCKTALPASTRAVWDSVARTTTCLECARRVAGGSIPQTSRTPTNPEPPPSGRAGASARHEYERRHQRREERIDQNWGRLAGLVKFITEDPQSTRAWNRGSEGERRLAEALARRVGNRAVLLHDRKVPKTRGNIDHIAISASGVWVIDAKTYKGLVERRDRGGWFKADYRLYVNRRDRTKLVESLQWQVNAVRRVLDDENVPVVPVLCFIDAEWRLFAKPFQIRGVWVTWGAQLAEMICAAGALTNDDVLAISQRLAKVLPPAVA